MEDFRLPKNVLYSDANGRTNRDRPRRRSLDSIKWDLIEKDWNGE